MNSAAEADCESGPDGRDLRRWTENKNKKAVGTVSRLIADG